MASPQKPVGPPEPNPDLLWRVVGDEALLLDTKTGNYFSMDPIATDIWKRLNEGESVEQISTTLAGKYSVDEPSVRHDIIELIAELRDAGLWN